MRENIAKKRLYAGETLYGIFANAISPELIEIMGITGFDFIVVDSEPVSYTHLDVYKRQVDTETLRDAQKNPDKYRDLLVRVRCV